MTDADVGGWIPNKNGFLEGYGVTVHNHLTANTGMDFRVYRNGAATECVFAVTSQFNDGSGCVVARTFNTNPQSHTGQSDRDVYEFKAGERIAVRAEPPSHPNFSETADITKINVFLYYTYDVITPEMLASQDVAGGSPGGSGVGDGSGTGEGNGNGGGVIS